MGHQDLFRSKIQKLDGLGVANSDSRIEHLFVEEHRKFQRINSIESGLPGRVSIQAIVIVHFLGEEQGEHCDFVADVRNKFNQSLGSSSISHVAVSHVYPVENVRGNFGQLFLSDCSCIH